MRFPRWLGPTIAATLTAATVAFAANNFPIDTSGGTRTTLKSTDNAGVQTPSVIIDSGTVTANGNTTPTIANGSGVVVAPSSETLAGVAPSATQAAASNSVLKSGAGNVYGLTVTVGATAGWAMLFDATALPSNGATGSTLKWCWPINSDGTKGGLDKTFNPPLIMTTGITVGFSSTACNSLTASATAFFYGSVK